MSREIASPNPDKTVLITGAGKAGLELHLPIWEAKGFSAVIHDVNPGRLEPATLPVVAKQMYEDGRLTTLANFAELSAPVDILDNTTPSGKHIQALESFIEHADRLGVAMPKAILTEKPITSSPEETEQLKRLIASGKLSEESVFVNENYNASAGVHRLQQIIDWQRRRDNPVMSIDVAFSKNRVPDVLAGRFTDPILGAYGIELPHQIAIAFSLADVQANDEVEVLQNDYFRDIRGIKHSEATFTELETDRGIRIRLAQGLGPFLMEPDGDMIEQDPGITRFVEAHFRDGTTGKVIFDPALGEARYHSIVEWQGERTVLPDSTLANVIGSVARYAASLQRDEETQGLSIQSALMYGQHLNHLRRTASEK